MNRFSQWRQSPPLKFLSANVGWIITSFILAFMLWIFVTLQENPIEQRIFPEPIEVTFIQDEDTVYIPDSATNASRQVIVRAPGSSWEVLSADNIEVVADLRGLDPGIHEVQLQARIQKDDLRARVVDILPTEFITIEIQAVKELIVNITPVVQTDPPNQYYYLPPVCTPNQVKVSGAESLVDQVAIATVSLSLRTITEPITIERDIILQNQNGRTLSGLQLDTPRTVCQVDIQPRGNISLSVEPNRIGEPATDYLFKSARATPSEVFVIGDADAIASMNGVVYTSPIDLTDRTSDFSVVADLVLPDGVRLDPPAQTIRVTVSIEPKLDSFTFADVPVQMENLDPTLVAILSTTEVSVIAFGPIPIIRDMTPEDFIVVVDLRNLSAGRYNSLPLTVEPIRGDLSDIEFTVQPISVDVTLNPFATPTPSPTVSPTPSPILGLSPPNN